MTEDTARSRSTEIAPDRSTFYGGGEKGYTDYPALAPVDGAAG